jgi:hypothetical protein
MHGASEEPLMSDAARRQRHGRSERGVLAVALAASALLHLAALFLFDFRIAMAPPSERAAPQPLVEIVPAMQVYELIEVPGEAAPIAVQIEERRMLERPADRGPPSGDPQSRVAGDDAPGAQLDPTSIRDRLRYRMAAPEVWQPPSAEREAELTPQQIVADRLAAQLGEFNDSLAAEAAARERAMDWTVKDGEGGRWGVSPGKIHLGGVTLPLPFALTAAPGRREEFAGRVRTWTELQAQAVRVEANDEFKDRVKAIEERMAKERAARGTTAADTTRPPPPPPANPPGNRSGG